MRSKDKSPEDRYSFGSDIQKRAKCLLEALLDCADEPLKFGNGFKQEEIEVTPLHSGQNGAGLEFNVKRNLLANWIGIKTENLTLQESKNVSEKVKNVVICLKKFEIISFYKPQKTGWWKLILPHADKNKLIKMLPAFMKCEEALAKLHRGSEEAVDTSESKLSFEQAVLDQSQPSYSLQGKKENLLEISHTIGEISFLEYFSKAIEQLKSQDLDVRIGAISTLGILSKYSQPADHWTIMEYLAAFIRTNAPRKEKEKRSPKISEDIQAALTIIGRRDWNLPIQTLDLSNTDLRGANLNGANLQGVKLDGANLQEVTLIAANLQKATLKNANLQRATMHKANLKRSNFTEADLQEADLDMTDLEGAELWNTNLQGTRLRAAYLQKAKLIQVNLQGAFIWDSDWRGVILSGVNLRGADFKRRAKNLESRELEDTYGDSKAASSLPENVKAPEHWMQST